MVRKNAAGAVARLVDGFCILTPQGDLIVSTVMPSRRQTLICCLNQSGYAVANGATDEEVEECWEANRNEHDVVAVHVLQRLN
jgi:hypothetical protein